MLETWFASEWGKGVLASQRELIDEALNRCFGYHLLQLSVDSGLELYQDCRVQRKYRCHPVGDAVNALSSYEQLPFANETLDAVILHHVHEFVDNPHDVLREMQRVVVPHGHLIIIGFNPWSPLGIYSRISHWMPNSMWQNNLIHCHRMKDWLGLLGFDINHVHYGYHSPGFLRRSEKPLTKHLLKVLPFGSFYLISAVKHVATMTPVKPSWKTNRKRFIGLAPVKPRATGSVICPPGYDSLNVHYSDRFKKKHNDKEDID